MQKDGKPQRVTAMAKMSVGLASKDKGTHMSRFVIQLKEWSEKQVFSIHLQEFLAELKDRLEAPTATTEVQFHYFVDKLSPVTEQSAPMGYNCTIKGHLNAQDQATIVLQLDIPMATLCPCSKAISDFGAHNQRAITRLDLILDTSGEGHPVVWIEDLVKLVDEQASCGVFPLLKRADEKWVTEKQYLNAKFTEDACRDVAVALNAFNGVKAFRVSVEALESIHPHNAWAAYESDEYAEQMALLPLR